MPLIELLSPAVEDVAVELHDALVVALGTIDVVDVVAVVGREGIGHLQVALGNRHRELLGVLPVFLRIGHGVGALCEDGVELHLVHARPGERHLGVLFVPNKIRCLLLASLQVGEREAPFVVGIPSRCVLGIGLEAHDEGCRA